MPSSAPLYGNYATQDTLIRQYSRSTECLFLFESMKLQRRQPMTVRGAHIAAFRGKSCSVHRSFIAEKCCVS